jgi:RNA polymerase sigma-70 factor (ECF subfamily)
VTLLALSTRLDAPKAAGMLSRDMPDPLPLAELVRAATKGDRAAFEALYGRMRGATHAVVVARIPARDAEDVVQDAFVTAWLKLPELREPAAFPGWLLEIARRKASAHARARRPLLTEDADQGGGAVAPVPRAEASQALRAIVALPEAYRETLLMRLLHGMSGPEIAEATGLSQDSVRVNLCRGLKLLRGQLDGGER